MTKKLETEKQPSSPVAVREQMFKHLVERLLNTSPKHETGRRGYAAPKE